MRKRILKGGKWLISALDNHSKGMSARKFIAFATFILYAYVSVVHVNAENLHWVLAETGIFCTALLGLTSYENIVRSKDPPEPPIEAS